MLSKKIGGKIVQEFVLAYMFYSYRILVENVEDISQIVVEKRKFVANAKR